jgi:hypothetical protein
MLEGAPFLAVMGTSGVLLGAVSPGVMMGKLLRSHVSLKGSNYSKTRWSIAAIGNVRALNVRPSLYRMEATSIILGER